MQQSEKIDPKDLNLTEKLINVNRVAKVVKRGKRMSFSALVVVGDGAGHVGSGLGKARVVPNAIQKAGVVARKNLIRVPLVGTTIPHEISAKFGASRVMLRPAAPGTGIIAGGAVRSTLEAAGVRDIITKSLGSSNQINVVRATLRALTLLKEPQQELVRRGKSVEGKSGG